MNKIKEYRESLSDEQIKDILLKYGVQPYHENIQAIIYPTVCHNPIGSGSNKLYYYKDNKIFRCFTECNTAFDIFELIMKMDEIQGKKTSLPEALVIAGIKQDNNIEIENREVYNVRQEIESVYELNHVTTPEEYNPLPLDEALIMNKYTYSLDYLKSWIEEGINPQTLNKFSIKFSTLDSAIIIPHYDDENNLIGVRGRFLSDDAFAKYKPVDFKGELLSHKTSRVLYGLNVTKHAIKKHKMAIIFEGEKSVMKMDSIYGNNNISIATSGKVITPEHINLLRKYGVEHIILAFDRDYKDWQEIIAKRQEYAKLVSYAKNFCNVSIIMDYDMKLDYKDSPIDKGKDTFEELMESKILL